jgi:hypothetical protein
MCSLGCPIRNASLKVAYFEVPIPGRFSLPADTGGVFSGDYKVRVSPYFFESEKGRLAIVVSDESLDLINRGKVATVVGIATTRGTGGKRRHIDAIATPADNNSGTIKLWFMAGDRKMTFQPTYHFSGKTKAIILAQTMETNFASSRP